MSRNLGFTANNFCDLSKAKRSAGASHLKLWKGRLKFTGDDKNCKRVPQSANASHETLRGPSNSRREQVAKNPRGAWPRDQISKGHQLCCAIPSWSDLQKWGRTRRRYWLIRRTFMAPRGPKSAYLHKTCLFFADARGEIDSRRTIQRAWKERSFQDHFPT